MEQNVTNLTIENLNDVKKVCDRQLSQNGNGCNECPFGETLVKFEHSYRCIIKTMLILIENQEGSI